MLLAFLVGAALAAQAAEPLPGERARALLQGFVDAAYLKAFRHLGDPRDFDHGHVLYDPQGRARAVLYHTQELALYHSGEFGYVDRDGRNWLQWLDTGLVERADRYRRADYPDTPAWRYFRLVELPGYAEHRTITAAMLDPALLGFEVAASRQWVFPRAPCGATAFTVRVASSDVCLATR